MKKVFLLTLLTSLVVSAAIGVVILLIGDLDDTQLKLLLTMLALGGFSLTGLASTSRPSSLWLWPVSYLGMASSTVALAVFVLHIWDRMDILRIWNLQEYDDWDRKLLATLIVLTISLAHMSLLAALQPANDLVGFCRRAGLLAVAAMGALLIGIILRGVALDSEGFYIRLVGLVAVLDMLGTAALAILARLAIVPKAAATEGRGKGGQGRKAPRRA